MKIRPLHAVLLAAFVGSGAAQAQAPAPADSAASTASAATAAVSAGGAVESGKIAWYGRKFEGRRTASGERYDADAMTMAHKSLPFGTKVKVTNPANGKSVVLRVNDRGPTQDDRVGDVSLAAARKLGMTRTGVIDAQLEIVDAR